MLLILGPVLVHFAWLIVYRNFVSFCILQFRLLQIWGWVGGGIFIVLYILFTGVVDLSEIVALGSPGPGIASYVSLVSFVGLCVVLCLLVHYRGVY